MSNVDQWMYHQPTVWPTVPCKQCRRTILSETSCPFCYADEIQVSKIMTAENLAKAEKARADAWKSKYEKLKSEFQEKLLMAAKPFKQRSKRGSKRR